MELGVDGVVLVAVGALVGVAVGLSLRSKVDGCCSFNCVESFCVLFLSHSNYARTRTVYDQKALTDASARASGGTIIPLPVLLHFYHYIIS